MKISRMAILVAAAAILMLATATSAFAENNSSPMVYGQATMGLTQSLVISGAGGDVDMPLVYEGEASAQTVPPNGDQTFTILNNGTDSVNVYLKGGDDPYDPETDITVYGLGEVADEYTAVWRILNAAGDDFCVPTETSDTATALGTLLSEESFTFDSNFDFPTIHYPGTLSMDMWITGGTE